MTRKNITVNINNLSPYDLDGTLKQVRARIDELIEQYGEDARFDWDANFYYPYDENPSPRYNVLITRQETEEEMVKRVEEEDKVRKLQEMHDRAELARLQAKFNSAK